MLKHIVISLLFCLCFTIALSQTNAIEPKGERLKTIIEQLYPDSSIVLGITSGVWALSNPAAKVINREFNYITPENEFKQRLIHPNNFTWNFSGSDVWVKNAANNNQIVRMHSPIGPQCSDWAKNDLRTKEEMSANMHDFIKATGERYGSYSFIKYIDAVNETVNKGSWLGPKRGVADWENPWTIIGYENDKNQTPSYIPLAFELYKKHVPNIKLLYNHHEGPEVEDSWNLIKETVVHLKSLGLRIDGIGWQAHVDNGWATNSNLQALSDLIDWTQQHNMEFHVTEASSFIKKEYNQSQLNLQAETYAKILNALLEKRKNGKVGWNCWHLSDAHTWRGQYYPALFDSSFNAKPAYYAIQKTLHQQVQSKKK